MTVGIGITTTPNREEIFNRALKAHAKHTKLDISVNIDTSFEGVGRSKNKLIKELKDNDIIILLDDDIIPIKDGWVDYLVNMHKNTNQAHFLLMDKRHHKFNKTWSPYPDVNIDIYDECSGVLMSFTKDCIDKVGYMDSRYKKYGYEHAGLSRRVFFAGLNSKPFMTPSELGSYFYVCDFEDEIDSSVSQEVKEANNEHNDAIYHDELANWFNYKREFND